MKLEKPSQTRKYDLPMTAHLDGFLWRFPVGTNAHFRHTFPGRSVISVDFEGKANTTCDFSGKRSTNLGPSWHQDTFWFKLCYLHLFTFCLPSVYLLCCLLNLKRPSVDGDIHRWSLVAPLSQDAVETSQLLVAILRQPILKATPTQQKAPWKFGNPGERKSRCGALWLTICALGKQFFDIFCQKHGR